MADDLRRQIENLRRTLNKQYRNVQGSSTRDILFGQHDQYLKAQQALTALEQVAGFKKWDITEKAHYNKKANVYGYETHQFTPMKNIPTLEEFKHEYKSNIIRYLTMELNLKKHIKVEAGITINGVFHKESGEDRRPFGAKVKSEAIVSTTELPQFVNYIFQCFQNALDGTAYFNAEAVKNLYLHVWVYKPMWRGRSYLKLPDWLANKKAVVNVKNTDNQCGKWAVLSAVHQAERNPDRLSHYAKYQHLWDLTGIDQSKPWKMWDFQRMDQQNQDLLEGCTIDVYSVTWEGIHTLCPIHRGMKEVHADKRIIILHYENKDGDGHYMWVKNWSRLVNEQGEKHLVCPTCMYCFSHTDVFDKHCAQCVNNVPVRVKMPKDPILKFKRHNRANRFPISVYCDFEACVSKGSNVQHAKSWMMKVYIKEGVPHPIGLTIHPTYLPKFAVPTFYYVGEDASTAFLETAKHISRCCFPILKPFFHKYPDVSDIQWYEGEEEAHEVATCCADCGKAFTTDDVKVADHDHITGRYRRALHRSCNLSAGNKEFGKSEMFIPFLFHNLKGYDGHHIINAVGYDSLNNDELQVIATSSEKYLSFTIIPDDTCQPKCKWEHYKNRPDWFDKWSQRKAIKGVGKSLPMRFIDTNQFVSRPLDELIQSLHKNPNRVKDGMDILYDGERTQLPAEVVSRKGVFPYDWDWYRNRDQKHLPPSEEFYNRLTRKHISAEDYEFAQTVWLKGFGTVNGEDLGCQTFIDYHNLYLHIDVGGLYDYFETFRNICLDTYGLDPMYYYGLPGFAWDALFKTTQAEVQLVQDPDMYTFCERAKRGGVSVQVDRYAKATDGVCIQYFDANSLYGYIMEHYALPDGGFQWMTDGECQKWVKDQPDTCFLEVDIETPPELHDDWNELPIPVKRQTTWEEQSPFTKECFGETFVGGEKLLGTLETKYNYIITARLLKYLIRKGHRLLKIHRGLKFTESPWMSEFITINAEKRQGATNDFERDVYKLMSNAPYGKTMEDVRKYVNFRLVKTTPHDTSSMDKVINSPFHKGQAGAYGEYLTGELMYPKSVTLNKPIYVGVAVLDYSKLHMFQMHYDVIKAQFGDRARLLMTDTDSLVYRIESKDFEAEMDNIKDAFDPSGHILGKLKDELKGKKALEYCGIRAKMYSVKVEEGGKSILKAKGIGKNTIKGQLPHEAFCDALLNGNNKSVDFTELKSKDHIIRVQDTRKKALNRADDKRFHLPPDADNNYRSLAFGHWRINNV